MFIYLMRHAEALDIGSNGVRSDSERPLSSYGKECASFMGQTLKQQNIPIDVIFSSPLKRAIETAGALQLDAQIINTPYLTPSGSIPDLCQQIQAEKKNILVVSHIPYLEILASYLLSASENLEIKFYKSAICAIEIFDLPPKGIGVLHWMTNPNLYLIPKQNV